MTAGRADAQPTVLERPSQPLLLTEHAELETRELADPAVHADPGAGPAARAAATPSSARSSRPTARWHAAAGDAAAARELAAEDAGVRRRAARRSRRRTSARRERLRRLLVPRDPDDDRDVILEIKAGEGGEESALFAGDLLRMYLRYAERQGWRTEVLDAHRERPRRLQGRRRSR